MSKRPSIVFQVTEVLQKAFQTGYGRSRHADKLNAKHANKPYDYHAKSNIYSRNSYNSTKKTVVNFAKHCRDKFGVRFIHEIKPEMFSSFIKGGNRIGGRYDPKTAGTYFSQVQKFQNSYNQQNGTELVFADKSYKEHLGQKEKKRDMMPREIHNQIIERAYNSKLENGQAFDLARNLGLRVSETTNLRLKDFSFENGELQNIHIHRSKGGRMRDIDAQKSLTSIQREKVIQIYLHYKEKGLGANMRLFINKTGSYTTAFQRYRETVAPGIFNHCGVHSMRKEFARDYYSRLVNLGTSGLVAKQELMQVMGHNRIDNVDQYL